MGVESLDTLHTCISLSNKELGGTGVECRVFERTLKIFGNLGRQGKEKPQREAILLGYES